ncbi:DMT family transporter [Helicobacter winghamensis]|uniref:Spermidine export protein MdtJ n=1 Tax=Helicobacter winghamensis TaxID=157268 RepID=A0A2N3PIP9_9HELI|nr:multidrug efflux SMR transporter [Helicobacter winghamensis]EEO25244.1 putative spermidine export protein MdtJ [Helicobacter winghamensis ATCC BAA-430]PKT76289.1 multidrug transporter [Helicobacter winghamensis]PKT76420.1 multidrug transporter [Helicobacter winghamensis]PKT76551.1 multidrug transporter [Helicobacter winghamensis]PKT80800.1 multidrug transporter [Helicobacter winghamensis]
MLKAWIFLILAIVCEVFGVSVMNYSQEENQIFVYGFMFVMIGIAYYFMSISIRTISVGVAYAIWEIVGLSLITIIAVFIFGTSLKTQEYIGLGLAIIGITLVNLGEDHNV